MTDGSLHKEEWEYDSLANSTTYKGDWTIGWNRAYPIQQSSRGHIFDYAGQGLAEWVSVGGLYYPPPFTGAFSINFDLHKLEGMPLNTVSYATKDRIMPLLTKGHISVRFSYDAAIYWWHCLRCLAVASIAYRACDCKRPNAAVASPCLRSRLWQLPSSCGGKC